MSKIEDEEKLNILQTAINSVYGRRKATVGDVVRYWLPTGEDMDTVDVYTGMITECHMNTLSDDIIYTIDNRYNISEKNVVGLEVGYYYGELLDSYRALKKKQIQDNPKRKIKEVIFNPPATLVFLDRWNEDRGKGCRRR